MVILPKGTGKGNNNWISESFANWSFSFLGNLKARRQPWDSKTKKGYFDNSNINSWKSTTSVPQISWQGKSTKLDQILILLLIYYSYGFAVPITLVVIFQISSHPLPSLFLVNTKFLDLRQPESLCRSSFIRNFLWGVWGGNSGDWGSSGTRRQTRPCLSCNVFLAFYHPDLFLECCSGDHRHLRGCTKPEMWEHLAGCFSKALRSLSSTNI